MSDTEQEETWPPAPRTPPPPTIAKSKPLARGYSTGFIGILSVILATLGLSAVPPSVFVNLILLIFGLILSILGFYLSIQDMRIGRAENNHDSIIVGGLGLLLNVMTLALTCFCAIYV